MVFEGQEWGIGGTNGLTHFLWVNSGTVPTEQGFKCQSCLIQILESKAKYYVYILCIYIIIYI
jgi:hypothetical protein